MVFENTEVFNIPGAIRGMRNPLNSWDKSDTDRSAIGEGDLELAKKLIAAGPEHAKFLRQIMVSVDITAPLFLHKELDTYKIGTTANSTSTMHKLAATPITKECFEMDDYDGSLKLNDGYIEEMWKSTIDYCETLRCLYLETKNKKYWKELIRILPESWLQKRTWTANYAVLRNIYNQRKNHKLTEWKAFCNWIETLPYAKDFLVE